MNFPGLEFFRIQPKVNRRRKKTSPWCFYVHRKTVGQGISCYSHAVVAKKWTKKRDARVEFLFYFQAFLTFSLSSPNSLLMDGNSSMINVTNTS